MALEKGGKSVLENMPEESRVHVRAPILMLAWHGSRGEPMDPPPPPTNPLAAIEQAFSQMQCLPEKAITVGETWSYDLKLGEAAAKITTTFKEVKTVNGKPCAVLLSTAQFTLPEAVAQEFDIKDMTLESVVPVDGGAGVKLTGGATIVQTMKGTQMHRVQTFTTTLVKAERLEGDALQKTVADAKQIQSALELARSNKLEEAMAALGTYLKDNPDAAWAKGVQTLNSEITRQRTLTQPLPPDQLRLILRNLQKRRDMAVNQNDANQLVQTEQTISQIATVNFKTVMEDSRSEDPIVRDLATFTLTFVADRSALQRLAELAADPSGQVRGTAIIALALRRVPADAESLIGLLRDQDDRVRGATALLVIQTVNPGDAVVKDVLPLLRENLASKDALTRANSLVALGKLSPKGSKESVRAILDAMPNETEEGLKATYLMVLKQLTDVDAKDAAAYEAWLKNAPATPAPAAAPAAPAETPAATPATEETPKPKG